MKILQLCHKPPVPAIDGGCIAMNNISQGLLQTGHELKILTIVTQKHPLQFEKLTDDYIEKTKIEGVYIDTSLNMIDAFSALVTSDSYNVSRFFSPDFDSKLTQLLRKEKFDIIHLESLFMTPYIATIRRNSKGKIVLRSHNLEYMIWERMAETSKNFAKKSYLKILAKQLKKYEFGVLDSVDGIAAISTEDGKKYLHSECNKPLVTIPFGINLDSYHAEDTIEDYPSLFHIGAMDWLPNIEGINWFLKEIWPSVNEKFPDLKFYLAGRKMPESFLQTKHKNVIVVGEIQDANHFMSSKSIMIVPLLTAGGIRVKIIEAMALKKSVISTSIGAHGIDGVNGKDFFIADKKEEFLQNLDLLLKDHQRHIETGKNARRLVEEKYDNRKLTEELVEFYQQLIATKKVKA
jgi:glycosyltransferase involved in cell wall biosynthesis